MKFKHLLLALSLTLSSFGANAAVIDVLFGDKDCFGIAAQGGAACATGIDYEALGGVFFEDNRELDDPLATDNWDTISRSFSIVFALPANLIGAELELFHAGAGTAGPTSILINGVSFGSFGSGDNLSSLSLYDIFSVIGSPTTVEITVSSGDGWSLDYAELHLMTADVPEPASLLLAALALMGLGFARRK